MSQTRHHPSVIPEPATGCPRILVLGYGNTLRGDDGLGWTAAEELAAQITDPRVEVIPCHQLGPELTEKIARADHVIFVDACCDRPAGWIACRRLEGEGACGATSGHQMSPEQLLGWAGSLFGHRPEAIVCSIGGQSFDLREDLSSVVRKSLDLLLARVRWQIEEWLKTEASGNAAKCLESC